MRGNSVSSGPVYCRDGVGTDAGIDAEGRGRDQKIERQYLYALFSKQT